MNINVNDVLTLHNNEKYLVLADAIYNDFKYYYLVEVTEDGEEVKDRIKVVKAKIDDDQTILTEVKDTNELEVVSNLLFERLEQNNLE
jgi:hypothetical protein